MPDEAFTGDRLEAQLARETRLFLGERRNVEIDPEASVIRLSEIFDWYAEDFRTPGGPRRAHAALRTYLERHLEGADRVALLDCVDCRIEFRPYDWSLNDRPPTATGRPRD